MKRSLKKDIKYNCSSYWLVARQKWMLSGLYNKLGLDIKFYYLLFIKIFYKILSRNSCGDIRSHLMVNPLLTRKKKTRVHWKFLSAFFWNPSLCIYQYLSNTRTQTLPLESSWIIKINLLLSIIHILKSYQIIQMCLCKKKKHKISM